MLYLSSSWCQEGPRQVLAVSNPQLLSFRAGLPRRYYQHLATLLAAYGRRFYGYLSGRRELSERSGDPCGKPGASCTARKPLYHPARKNTVPASSGRCFYGYLSGRRELNPGPLAPHASALAGLRHAPIQQHIIAAKSRIAQRESLGTPAL